MSQAKTQTATTKRIHSVTIKRMIDETPDSSYLDQDEFEDRKLAYIHGDFVFLGIRVEAEVSLCRDAVNNGCWTIQRITSGGIWGIESDSDDSYLKEIENDELALLREQLEAMGFSKRAVSAAFRNVEHSGR